jgi:molybdopterin synthase catalytic subunit
MNNKLPWEAYFYGTIDKRTIRDAERHTVNVYDAANAEFIVTAVNAYEANQTEIASLKAKLELCREVMELFAEHYKGRDDAVKLHTCKYCGLISLHDSEICLDCVAEHVKEALEAIEGREGE